MAVKRQGFTLIELLVVVLIIGILASVALPQYFKTVEKSRASEGISALSSIAAAQDREFMRNGSAYATSIDQLDVEVKNLKYFNPPAIAGNTLTITRNQSTALGQYTLSLILPASPGAGGRTWSCAAACKTLIPAN